MSDSRPIIIQTLPWWFWHVLPLVLLCLVLLANLTLARWHERVLATRTARQVMVTIVQQCAHDADPPSCGDRARAAITGYVERGR